MKAAVQNFLNNLQVEGCYSESTRQAYSSDLQIFLGYLSKTLQRPLALSDFNSEQVATFLDAERENGRGQSTLLRRRATLQRFEKYLHQNDLIGAECLHASPLLDRAVAAGSSAQPPAFLTAEHVNQLWSVLEKSNRPLARRDHAILALLLDTGLTVSTLIVLQLSDLDLPAGKLNLAVENEESYWVSLGTSVDLLDKYLKKGRPEINHSPDEPALFISQVGGPMCRQSVWQVLRHWGRVANLPIRLSPRVLRHTAVLNMILAGRTETEIQILLGHRNQLSTQALLQRLQDHQFLQEEEPMALPVQT